MRSTLNKFGCTRTHRFPPHETQIFYTEGIQAKIHSYICHLLSVLVRPKYYVVLRSLSSFARRSCSSISLTEITSYSKREKSILTWLPTDNQALITDQESQKSKRSIHILPHILHLGTCIVSWWENREQHVNIVTLARNSTHGIFGGRCPSLSLSLLCTTKIANFVRFDSRSDSGSRSSSDSTSLWSSDNAYLWIERGKILPTARERAYCRVLRESSTSSYLD